MKLGIALHILGGGLGIVAGMLALSSAKGSQLHRRAGLVFVAAMLMSALTGGCLAAVLGESPRINIPAALIVIYLVTTALTTVRPATKGAYLLNRGGILVGVGVGIASTVYGLEALAQGGELNGIPAFPFFLFGAVGLLAAGLDVRMLRSGGLRGAERLARHLWRMCFALYVAVTSLFIGQADIFPEALRHPALLASPVVAVVVAMFYWLWRVRRPLY